MWVFFSGVTHDQFNGWYFYLIPGFYYDAVVLYLLTEVYKENFNKAKISGYFALVYLFELVIGKVSSGLIWKELVSPVAWLASSLYDLNIFLSYIFIPSIFMLFVIDAYRKREKKLIGLYIVLFAAAIIASRLFLYPYLKGMLPS